MGVINPIIFGAAADVPNWIRPNDWLVLPTVITGQQKLVGLHAVFDSSSNFLTILAVGNYTVNIYNGAALITTSNLNSNSYFYHNLNYANFEGSECSRGYRQAIIEIIPQSGQNLSVIDLSKKHNQTNLHDAYSSGWLDINVVGSSISVLNIHGNQQNSYAQINHYYLECINFVGPNSITYCGFLFAALYALRYINIELNSNIISFSYAFSFLGITRKNYHTIFANFTGASITDYRNFQGIGDYTFNVSAATYFTNAFQNVDTLHLTNIAANANFTQLCYNGRLRSFSCDNAANIAITTNAWGLCYNLAYFSAPGIRVSFNLQRAPLSFAMLTDIIQNQLADLTGLTAQVFSCNYTWGSSNAGMAALAAWAAANKNWTIIYS